MQPGKSTQFGIVCAVVAQLVWGCFPVYIDWLSSAVSPFVFVASRTIWAFVFLCGLTTIGVFLTKRSLPTWQQVREVFRRPSLLGWFVLTATLIATNWMAFVWAVTHEKKIEASLGYYICPQVVVLLGWIFEKERLAVSQWLGVLIAGVGVAYLSRSVSGVPWFGLAVAFSFGFYGLLKKRLPQSALTGLTVETGLLFAPAMLLLLLSLQMWTGENGSLGGASYSASDWWLLLGSGPLTVLPLALHVSAVKHIPLSMAGLLQFLGPTVQFALGVFLFGEPFDRSSLAGFAFVWVGVAFYLATYRKKAG